jgi:superoxide dismutase
MFELPTLKYELNALEPYISQKTMEFHYLKHHQGYLNKLNELIQNTEYQNMSLIDIINNTANKPHLNAIFNNAAQTFNHTFFWNSMCANGGNTQVYYFKDVPTAIENLKNIINKGDAVLVKASRAMKLETVVEALKNIKC